MTVFVYMNLLSYSVSKRVIVLQRYRVIRIIISGYRAAASYTILLDYNIIFPIIKLIEDNMKN